MVLVLCYVTFDTKDKFVWAAMITPLLLGGRRGENTALSCACRLRRVCWIRVYGFFVYEPGRFRHGPVFGSARGPRSLCVGRNVQAHAAQNTDALFDATAGYGRDCSLITLSGRWGGDISAEAAAISAAFQF